MLQYDWIEKAKAVEIFGEGFDVLLCGMFPNDKAIAKSVANRYAHIAQTLEMKVRQLEYALTPNMLIETWESLKTERPYVFTEIVLRAATLVKATKVLLRRCLETEAQTKAIPKTTSKK